MGFKHTLKRALRDTYAWLLVASGLWRLTDRLTPRRMLVLAGHCVDDAAVNGDLPADMRISPGRLEELLAALGRRYRLVTLREGLAALDVGTGGSLVALTMDDGYRDNLTVLLPLLERVDGRCTVFLEAAPLAARRPGWLHQFFWMVSAKGARAVFEACLEGLPQGELRRQVTGVEQRGGSLEVELKRALKYAQQPDLRDETIGRLFREWGGDERALCDRIYLDWDGARQLAQSGRVELGGHTVHHPVLTTLSAERGAREIQEGREVLAAQLGEETGASFAYPYGRRWDFEPGNCQAVREAGYRAAVTTHAGVVTADTDRLRLPRWMLEEETPLYLLQAEAAGGFELLRRLGLDLVE